MKKKSSSKRPTKKELKKQRKEKKQAEKELRRSLDAEGIIIKGRESLPNHKCPYINVEEEQSEREEAVTEQLRIMRSLLPILLKRLSKIKDPRNPKKIKYKLTVLMIYGILSFIFQMASRREANREMTRPMFIKNLQIYFPELEDLPHNDTLMRLLSGIEVDEIGAAHIELIRKFVRNKKFRRYLIDNCYPIAIDGTQKFVRKEIWSEECLERKVKKGEGEEKQYYVYVVEANLAFHNGMTIPLMSEFLNYAEGDTDNNKQDCETKAFHRIAQRLKQEFPRLPIMVLLDGLYPNGPIMEHCIKNRWQFMIVLKDNSLPNVWKEYEVLRDLEKNNNVKMTWANRKQCFHWVNEIEYRYENDKKKVILHVVVCEETWKIVNSSGKVETKNRRHAWVSSKPLNISNVHARCNLGARNRWCIETGILVEKRHGYQYEHCFSYNWNAMKGYHYLMRIGHAFSILAQYSDCLIKKVKELGHRGFIKFIRETITSPWLDKAMIIKRLNKKFQLRLA